MSKFNVVISWLIVGSLLLLTVTTGVLAFKKIIEIKKPQLGNSNNQQTLSNVQESVITPTPVITNAQKPVATPTSVIQPTNIQSSSMGKCVIVLFGKQYDVAPLKSSHTGGDIFVCNTDMTIVYQNQHGSNISRMQKYLITGDHNSTNTTPFPTLNPDLVKTKEEDERDDD